MSTVKIKKVTVHNLKNVRDGEVTLSVDFDSFFESNVVGVYGQNGSGKTTIVDAFSLLKTLISGWISNEKLQLQEKRLITAGEETASLDFDFLVQNEFGAFCVNYFVAFQEDDERIYTTVEIEQAVRIGILEPSDHFKVEDVLTRQEFAEWSIRALDLEKAAQYSNIYKLNFADANTIQPSYTGYIALANEMGLLVAQDNKINATGNVTYADLAVSIIRLAHKITEKDDNHYYW